MIGDRVVLDTTGAKLLHETGALPVPYVPLADFDGELLERTDHTTHCPFKGDASYWHVRAGDARRRERGLGVRGPAGGGEWLDGFGALYWNKATRGSSRRSPSSAACATRSTASTCTRARAR